MKKLLGIMAVTALTVSAFAQGTVVFQNATGKVKQWTSSTDSTLVNVAVNAGKVQLIAAPLGTALPNPIMTGTTVNFATLAAFLAANPGWAVPTGTGTTTGISGLAGGFGGGNATIESIGMGASAEYIVLGWTGTAATWDLAVATPNVMLGVSAMFTTTTSATTGSPAPPAPVNLRTSFTGMTLAPVPEPGTFALAGLGLAALLVFRRRN